MEWKNIYRGLVMGASDVIPGVSGGTIAVLLGIYDRLIAAINGLFSRDWKKHLGFLIPLGIGIALAIFSLSRLMEWLLMNYPGPTYFFFLGLIFGVLPLLLKQADAKNNFRAKHYGLLIIGIAFLAFIGMLHEGEKSVITNITLTTYILLFFSGILGSSAMILPGISGSFVLLVIGVYPTIISAISNLQLDIIFATGAGIAVGIILMSKVINYFLTRYPIATYSLIIGMVIGSVFVIFPGAPETAGLLAASVVAFFGGLLAAYILGKVEY